MASAVDVSGASPHADDLGWAAALAVGDRAALERFEREVAPAVAAALRRRGLATHEIEELQQELRAELLVGRGDRPAPIADYRATGSLKSWVVISAVRAAIKQRRRAAREPAAADDDLAWFAEAAETRGDPTLDAFKGRYRDVFRAALRVALAGVTPRERTLLRMAAIDGLSIDQLGALHGVHRATAARWLDRAREQVFAATRTEMMRRLGSDRWEVESILRLIGSRLDASFSGMGTAGGPG